MNISNTTCSNDFPTTHVLFEELTHRKGLKALTAISGIVCLFTIAIYVEGLWYYIHHYDDKRQKKKVIYILGLYPVISVKAIILLLVPVTTLPMQIISYTYLTVAVLVFVKMIIDHFEGEENLLTTMKGEMLSFGTPPICCFCRYCFNVQFTSKSFSFAKVLVWQAIFIQPLMKLILFILWMAHKYIPGDESNPTEGAFVVNVVNVTSSMLAIWGSVVIFHGTRRQLTEHSIILKFICLQLIIIFSNPQLAIINQLASRGIIVCEGTRGPFIQASRIQHYLLLFEMFVLSIVARFAYRKQQDSDETQLKPVY